MEFWIEIGRSFGVPVMVLGALMLGCYKVARWVGNELVIPVRDVVLTKALNILDKMDRTITALESGMREMVNSMESYTRVMINLESFTKTTSESLREIVEMLGDVKARTDTLANSCPILIKPPAEQPENTTDTATQSRATPAHGIPTSTRILTHIPGQIPPTPGHSKRGPKS